MAIPSLAAMAALTLLQNTHMQPEDVSVDYSDLSAPATVLQRFWRRRGVLNRAATRINALMRAFSVRCFISCQPGFMNTRNGVSDFLMYGFQPGFMEAGSTRLYGGSIWSGVRDRLISPRDMRYGRRYLAQRRALARSSYLLNTSSVPPPLR